MEQNLNNPQALTDEHRKRQKTGGEHLFDLTAYGGLALVGNEVTATAIVKQKDAENLVGSAYRTGERVFERIGPRGKLPYIQQRMNYITFAIIGGMMMVPLIKWLEDNKGTLVRFADRILHGEKAQTTPEMIRAHAEMDEAPRQSWSSLMKGRAITVGTAFAMDAGIGWRDGWSARALKGTRFEKFSSFDHAGQTVADFLAPKISKLAKLTPEKTVRLNGWLNTGLGLLTLSTALTALFYGSSKFIASRRDERLEKRLEQTDQQLAQVLEPATPPSRPPVVASEKPGTKVHAAQPDARVQTVQQEGLHA